MGIKMIEKENTIIKQKSLFRGLFAVNFQKEKPTFNFLKINTVKSIE